MRFLTLLAFCLLLSFAAPAGDFHGFACTQDCSGHKAGYAWAGKKNITREENCTGNSKSFREGCIAWVREHAPKPPETPSSVPEKH